MSTWRVENNPGMQFALAFAMTLLGVLFVYLCRHYTGPGMTNSLAGYLSGWLLLLIGGLGILVGGKQTVTVEGTTRRIVIEDSNRFRTKQRVIPFNLIEAVSVGYFGKASNFVNFYFLVLHLRGGERYTLFPPGRFYPGSSNRSAAESWRQRLEAFLAQSDIRSENM
jgi:hypothetical protein